VQFWTGASWQTAGTFSGKVDDFQFNLPEPITTTRLRIYDVTSSPGNSNAILAEWYVYPDANCQP
jgi:hypothetical protein